LDKSHTFIKNYTDINHKLLDIIHEIENTIENVEMTKEHIAYSMFLEATERNDIEREVVY
jgi:hypothetical protein